MGEEIARLLRECCFRYVNEGQLQAGIEMALTEWGLPFTREARIDVHNRIDFLVADSIGIEVKVDGSGPLVARQLRRYMRLDEITELILVTSRTKHWRAPQEIEGKRLHVVWLSLHGL